MTTQRTQDLFDSVKTILRSERDELTTAEAIDFIDWVCDLYNIRTYTNTSTLAERGLENEYKLHERYTGAKALYTQLHKMMTQLIQLSSELADDFVDLPNPRHI